MTAAVAAVTGGGSEVIKEVNVLNSMMRGLNTCSWASHTIIPHSDLSREGARPHRLKLKQVSSIYTDCFQNTLTRGCFSSVFRSKAELERYDYFRPSSVCLCLHTYLCLC